MPVPVNQYEPEYYSIVLQADTVVSQLKIDQNTY